MEGYTEVNKGTSRELKGNLTVRLTKTILRPLLDASLVTAERQGRNVVVHLTPAGEYMECLLVTPTAKPGVRT